MMALRKAELASKIEEVRSGGYSVQLFVWNGLMEDGIKEGVGGG